MNYKSSALEKLVGKSPFQLAQHFIQEHIIPYMKLYFKEETIEQGMSVAEVQRIEGDIAEIVPKIRQLIQNITTGFIIIKRNNLRASIQVINGQPTMMKMIKGNKIITGNDVLASLVMESGSGVAVAYEIDVEKALDSASEQVSKSIDISQRKYESQA
ncbi:hypothetical protein [Metallosphaera hakonensis]|uniref:hypothetical protein n=1 Tax=Metallosphaera hakonensis TaxID=79601 RepID=UPI0006CFF364|nr:hypothetical protein [Metallosphaera hakonensis]